MLTLFVLMLLVVIGGAATVGGVMYASEKRRRLGAARTPAALPAGDSPVIERTIRNLRVGDVLTVDARDFLVEGTIGYDEDGHRWTGARMVDGTDTRWLIVGIERVGSSPVRLLTYDKENEVSGYPPETIVIGELRYALDKRGTATCKLAGDVGTLGAGPDKVARCRWWLYNGTGDDTLVLEQWGNDFRMLRGKKVSPDTIDLIPGS